MSKSAQIALSNSNGRCSSNAQSRLIGSTTKSAQLTIGSTVPNAQSSLILVK